MAKLTARKNARVPQKRIPKILDEETLESLQCSCSEVLAECACPDVKSWEAERYIRRGYAGIPGGPISTAF